MVSMDFALRHHGLPTMTLWETLLERSVQLAVHEDNQAMIRIMETGRNPTMRYLHRTHRISVSWLHEVFKSEGMDLQYELSARMCADIYTKAFTDPLKWKAACWLIGVVDPRELKDLVALGNDPPPQAEGSKGNKAVDDRNPDGSGTWTRADYGARRFRATLTDGPDWKYVTRRVTVDADSGEVIEDLKNAQKASKHNLYLELSGGS